jgi:hypothetical protein
MAASDCVLALRASRCKNRVAAYDDALQLSLAPWPRLIMKQVCQPSGVGPAPEASTWRPTSDEAYDR